MKKIPRIILLVETAGAYGRGILRGITKYSRIHGPWAFYSEPGGAQEGLPALDDWGADGIVSRVCDAKKAEMVLATGLPVIFCRAGSSIPSLPNIVEDSDEVAAMAAQHFLERGLKQIAFAGFSDIAWSVERGRAFSNCIAKCALAEHFYTYERTWSNLHKSWGHEQMLLVKWLRSMPKPLGVVTCDDDHGRRIIEACKVADLNVPDEVSVLGVDNDSLMCELAEPPLSSVALDIERAGYEAAELLHRLMSGEKMGNQRIFVHPTHVVTRQSTDIVAVEDPEVAVAIRFIRENAKDPIQVRDVAEHACVSRQWLHKRFCTVIGRSIHEEIRHARTEMIVRMLMETDMPMFKIASILGFSDAGHMSRYFRQQMGVSPKDYRSQHHP